MAEKIVVPSPPRGVKTSEFWVTITFAVAAMLEQAAGFIPAPWGTICGAAAVAAYAIARALTKLPTPSNGS